MDRIFKMSRIHTRQKPLSYCFSKRNVWDNTHGKTSSCVNSLDQYVDDRDEAEDPRDQ